MASSESVEHFIVPASGDMPNNEALPVILYKGVADFGDCDPVSVFQDTFARHNWGSGWVVDSIYHFHHFHSDAHEVVGFAHGTATLQFGGPDGPIIEVEAGDAAVIPAGVGHCRLDHEPGLRVVGAYPPGQSPDMCVLNQNDERTANQRDVQRASITGTALPETDPLLGDGPVTTLWGKV